MNLRDVLAPFIGILKRRGIAFAIIGGYAVAAWGRLRATRDIDLLCHPGDLNLLKSSLKEAGLSFEHRIGDFEDPNSDVIRIDAGSQGDIS